MILGCRVWDFASLDLGFRVRLRFRVEFGLRVWVSLGLRIEGLSFLLQSSDSSELESVFGASLIMMFSCCGCQSLHRFFGSS